MENILEIKNLTKEYHNFRLDDVSFKLPQGCIMGLIGENGAGKTTTIKLILNLLHRRNGKITIFGKDNILNEREIKEEVGVVFSELHMPETFTGEQIDRVMKGIYAHWDNKVFFGLLDRFRLDKDMKIKAYSRGMKMKLAIAVAMSHHAKLLILDEPTSGLDPVVRDKILDLFLELIVYMLMLQSTGIINMYYALIAVMSIMTTFTLDKACEWESYALCLPLTRKLIVKSKYLLVLIIDITVGVFTLLCSFTYTLASGCQPVGEVFASFGVITVFLVFVQMILVPLMYRWGVEKGRYIFIALCMVPFFCIYMFKSSLAALTESDMLFLIVFIAVIAAASVPVSYLSSVKIYNGQEL